jgi:hypothetical protein
MQTERLLDIVLTAAIDALEGSGARTGARADAKDFEIFEVERYSADGSIRVRLRECDAQEVRSRPCHWEIVADKWGRIRSAKPRALEDTHAKKKS